MLEPVIKTVEVSCKQEKAYETFTKGIGNWWPLDKFSMSSKAGGKVKSLQAELKVGGKIVEISEDGTEYVWATIQSYEPSSFFSLNFFMGDTPDRASVVEVKFTETSPETTTIELKQSNWEACGNMAEDMRKAYDFAWGMVFEQAFKKACESE